MSGRLTDKVAIVTGAGSGIGLATASRFAAEGARVIATDLNSERLSAAVDRFGNDACLGVAADVTSADDCRALVDGALSTYGRLDVLVNCAGITRRDVSTELPLSEAWRIVMEVNVIGSVQMCEAALSLLQADGGGSIVNLGSVMSSVVHSHQVAMSDGFNPYPASKASVAQLTRDLGVRYAARGVRVNAVCPGFVTTPLTSGITDNAALHAQVAALHPMGRFAEPEEIANVILFLASDEASFVTAAAWTVDGGYTAI